MKSFDEFYWKHNDCLNKDTSLAHSFGEKVWNHKKAEVDGLQARVDKAMRLLQTRQHNADVTNIIFEMHKILKGDQS